MPGGEGDRARQSGQGVNIWKGEQTGISNRVVRAGVTEKVISERRLEARGFAYRQQYSNQKKQPCKGPMGKLCGMFMEKPRGQCGRRRVIKKESSSRGDQRGVRPG